VTITLPEPKAPAHFVSEIRRHSIDFFGEHFSDEVLHYVLAGIDYEMWMRTPRSAHSAAFEQVIQPKLRQRAEWVAQMNAALPDMI
jgi:hypothetical protein